MLQPFQKKTLFRLLYLLALAINAEERKPLYARLNQWCQQNSQPYNIAYLTALTGEENPEPAEYETLAFPPE